MNELFHQDQMSRTADRKPFRDALHDSQGGQQPGPDMGGAQAGSASSDPNVVDADYEVVDDDNQK